MDWMSLAASFAAKPSGGGGDGASGYSMANRNKADGTAYQNSPFDSSNWTVATGSARASATNTSASGKGLPGGADNQIAGIPTSWIIIGVVLVLVLKAHK